MIRYWMNEPRKSEGSEERRVLESFYVSFGKLSLLEIFCHKLGKLVLKITQDFVFCYLVKGFNL